MKTLLTIGAALVLGVGAASAQSTTGSGTSGTQSNGSSSNGSQTNGSMSGDSMGTGSSMGSTGMSHTKRCTAMRSTAARIVPARCPMARCRTVRCRTARCRTVRRVAIRRARRRRAEPYSRKAVMRPSASLRREAAARKWGPWAKASVARCPTPAPDRSLPPPASSAGLRFRPPRRSPSALPRARLVSHVQLRATMRPLRTPGLALPYRSEATSASPDRTDRTVPNRRKR